MHTIAVSYCSSSILSLNLSQEILSGHAVAPLLALFVIVHQSGLKLALTRLCGSRSLPCRQDQVNDSIDTLILLHHGKDCWSTLTHPPAVTLHDVQISADCLSKIDLVDDQQIGLCDSRSTLARNLVASRYIDDVDDEVGKFAGVVSCEVVAARFDEEEVGVELVVEVRKGQEID